jgi:AcrR family transcriptional regulator
MARDGTATRERIKAAALALFVEQGVAGTSTRDIAEQAGVAEGALYRHFEGKDDLAWSLFRDNYAVLADELTEVCDRAGDCRGAIAAMIARLCVAFDEERPVFRYLLLARHDHVRRVTPAMKSPIRVVHAVMERAIAGGEIGVADAHLATALALGPLLQTAAAIIYDELPAPIARWRDAITAATLRAVDARKG